MRLLRIGLVALVAAPFAVAAGETATAGHAAGRCSLAPGLVAPPLPAAIRVTTSCGSFRIGADGRIARVSSDPPPFDWLPPDGIWSRSDRGHLVVGRWQRTLWRSTGRFSRRGEDGYVAIVRNRVVFSYGNRALRLYDAPLGGRERLVADGEFPLGAAPGGFYTRRVRGAELVLRSATGGFRATVARSVGTYAYAPDGQRLLFLERGRLLRAQGAHVRPLANLSRLRIPARHLQIVPLGRLVGLENERRLVVLRPDGSLFASTALPFATGRVEFISGVPTAAPDGAAVAFAAIRGDSTNEEVMERGVETVYVLRPGGRAAAVVDRQRTWFNVCGHTADLAWYGTWLLYAADGGGAAAIDIDGDHTIGLSSIVRRLPGFPHPDPAGGFGLGWS